MKMRRRFTIAAATILALGVGRSEAFVELPANMRPPRDEELGPGTLYNTRAAQYAWKSVEECRSMLEDFWRSQAKRLNLVINEKQLEAAKNECTPELVASHRQLALDKENNYKSGLSNCLAKYKLNQPGVVIGMVKEDVLICGWGKPDEKFATDGKNERWVYRVPGFENVDGGGRLAVLRTHYLNFNNGTVVSMPDGPVQRPF